MPESPTRIIENGRFTIRRIVPEDAAATSAALRTMIENVRDAQIDLTHFYGAVDDTGRVRAAMLLVPQPGGTGLVFPGRLRKAGEGRLLTQVAEACCQWVTRREARIAQALLTDQETRERAALETAGFWRLAKLAYMQTRVLKANLHAQLPEGLRLETYRPANHEKFLQVLEASYVDTLDCPKLCGMRDTNDILQGHQATGEFDPEWWTLVYANHQPAGVLLLNRVPQANSVELTYIGVSAAHRGKGLARELMKHAMRLCVQRHETQITLALDANNAPAMELYRRFGFYRTAEREALIRPIDGEE